MVGKNDAKLTIRLPKELLDKVNEKSDRADIPVSQYLRHCMRKWVEEDPPDEQKGEEP